MMVMYSYLREKTVRRGITPWVFIVNYLASDILISDIILWGQNIFRLDSDNYKASTIV